MVSTNCPKIYFVAIYLLLISVGTICGKIYQPCDLAQEMIKLHRFPKDDIANWICLIRWESNFDTSAIGRLNSDGSLDHGLFQISDKYWCVPGKVDGACGINCDDLRNDNIRDDSVCARRIFRITKFKTKNGFDAWAGWKQHCQGQDVLSYISNCTLTD